jgi:fatty acid desaturase
VRGRLIRSARIYVVALVALFIVCVASTRLQAAYIPEQCWWIWCSYAWTLFRDLVWGD